MCNIQYREKMHDADPFRAQYLAGLEGLIDRLEQQCRNTRNPQDILDHPEKYRSRLCQILGWPLTQERPAEIPQARFQLLSEEEELFIYRAEITVLDDITMCGLLFRHKGEKLRPLVLCQHGGAGSPEIISGVFGNTYNYNDLTQRVLALGANAFAPQLLLWNKKEYGPADYSRDVIDSKLKDMGSSITAIELYGMMRILDYFEAQDWVGKLGMVGLSYGGFYTQFLSAVDTRIQAALSCSFFREHHNATRPDWCWRDLMREFGQAELVCLVAPRKLYLQMGNRDDLFDAETSRAEFARLPGATADGKTDWAELLVFDGVHELCKSDEHMRKVIAALK